MNVTTDPIERLTDAIETGTWAVDDLFTDDAVLDATVPDWRFTVSGGSEVRGQLAGWFADPGRFESLRRTPLPEGALVEFTLSWEEHGVPHACHQAHIVTLRGGRIAADTVFCGGRWSAGLLAEMAEAAAAAVGERG